MSKWLLFPLIAARVWAQQAAPAASDAEKALRERVEQFYQLQMDKKYRQAEAFVAEDTKDWYFASKKPDLDGFTIQKLELLDNATRAKVTVKTKSSMMMMGVGRLPIEIPTETLWRIENGNWVWYVDTKAPMPTPFGAVSIAAAPNGAPPPDVGGIVKAADVGSFQRQVTIDTTNVTLTAAKPSGAATITNGLPGYVEVAVEKTNIPGFSVHVDKSKVGAGEKAVIQIERSGDKPAEGVVHVTVSPLSVDFDIHVHAN